MSPGKDEYNTFADQLGSNFISRTHYLRIYVMQLRQKIEHDPTRPRLLLTEPAVGY